MRHTLLLCYMLFACISLCCGQAIVDSALRYRTTSMNFREAMELKISEVRVDKPADTSEGSGLYEFSRKALYREKFIGAGIATGSELFVPATEALMTAMTSNNYCMASAGGGWRCIGPFKNGYDNQGRVNSVWVHPTNPNIVIAGTFGGVWKTTNGGVTWNNISDNVSIGYGSSDHIPGTMGIWSMAVNPVNHNIIYVFLSTWWGTAMGAAYTTNGGATWHSDPAYNSMIGFNIFDGVGNNAAYMKYMPGTQRLFSYMNGKILMKSSPASPWANITPLMPSGIIFTDMEFTIANPYQAVFSTNAPGYVAHLVTCDSFGSSWDDQYVVIPPSSDTLAGITSISVSATDSVFMLLSIKHQPQHYGVASLGTIGLNIISTNTGHGFEHIAVSPNNTKVIYATVHDGYTSFYKSTDHGASFSSVKGLTHADARYITLYSAASPGDDNGDVLYGGSDGGVAVKRYGNVDFESITGEGLCITNFFGMSNTEADDGIALAGAQDNGVLTYNRKRPVGDRWTQVIYGDGFIPKFLRRGKRIAYSETNFPELQKVTFGATSEIAGGIPTPIDACSPDFWNNCNNVFRPWFIDKNNTAYVGYSRVWKQDSSSYSWTPAFNRYPFHDSTRPIIIDNVVAENNPDLVYIAYKWDTRNDTILTGNFNPYGRLFKSVNATAALPTWLSITPKIIGDKTITDIEVDPNNPARIWVALGYTTPPGTLLDSTKHRVLYSSDYGANWTDVSTGLPPLPVNRIKFRESSNDELYCATTLGVYKCDFSTFNPSASWWSASDGNYVNRSVRWKCFNDGMPICDVTDMEFNYCANKLRISTLGRGMWETELQSLWDIIEGGKVITGGITSWTEDKYITGGIRVKTGSTLNIQNCTVHMPRNGALIVEPGALLIVDNARITNNCEDGCLWFGIEAIGNPTLAQVPFSNQARVVIRNGSVIEHARYAVSNCDYWNDPVGTTGGIIQATSSTFHDNHNSVMMKEYHAPGSPHPANISYFDNCTFVNDVNYRGMSWGYYFGSHVDLNGVEGIRFAGCKFINRDSRLAGIGQGVGIRAVNSGFAVRSYCATGGLYAGPCPDMRRSYFCGLEDGIVIKDVIGTGASVSIDEADFDSVSIGILNSGYQNAAVTKCKFIVGRGNNFDSTVTGLSTCGNIGIALQNVQLFKMEGNSFKGKLNPSSFSYSSWMNFGVVVANGGPFGKKIYRNTFDSLTRGITSVGRNRGLYMGLTYGMGGLQIECNTFSRNNTDISVLRTAPGSDQGIGPDLGAPGMPVKNTFSASANNITNNCGSIGYYYDSTNTIAEKPTIVSPNVFTGGTNNAGNPCASTFPYPDGSMGTAGSVIISVDAAVLTGPRTAFYGHEASLNTLLATYRGLIDFGGPAQAIIDYIDTSTMPALLYDLLASGSPYLSDSTLIAMISMSQLSYNQMGNILNMNPEALRHDEVLTYATDFFAAAQANNQQLPDYVSAINNAAQTGITARTQLQGAMAYQQRAMYENLSIILMALRSPVDTSVSVSNTTGAGVCTDTNSVYYSLDSNSFYYGFDSLDTWLQKLPQPMATYERVSFYSAMHNFNTANNIFYSLNRNTLTADEQEEYDAYKSVWNVVYAAKSNGRSLYQLTNSEINALDTFTAPVITANKGMQLKWNLSTLIRDHINDKVAAAGLSTTTTLYPALHFPCVVELLSDSKPGSTGYPIKSPFRDISNLTSNSELYVHPNPSNGIVTFECNVPKSVSRQDDITITVTSIMGELVMEKKVTKGMGKVIWDPKNLAPGVYIYQARNVHGVFSKGKVVLVR